MMKKELIFAFLMIGLLSCKNHNKSEEIKITGKPGIIFELKEYNFDTLEYKEKAVYKFKFKNIGDQPLLINRVSASCGCTATEYSKKPYSGGKKGFIKVEYDTKRTGSFLKQIFVLSNADGGPIVLTIKGFVKKDDRVSDNNNNK